MKITVLRRGVAIIHMPNQTVYSPDIWDERVNEKIEREWIKGGVSKPRYSRLTTFKGFIYFSKLTEKQENIYQQIKDDKRNLIAKSKGIDSEEDKPKTPFEIVYAKFINKEVKNAVMLEGMMLAHNLKLDTTKEKIRRQLKKDNKKTYFNEYYYDPVQSISHEELDKAFE